jgi:hypothetical protein
MTTSVSISPTGIQQFFDNCGRFNAGGSVLTQVGGINYATYQDAAGTIPLPNPIPLNSRGEVSNAAGVSCQLFLVNGVTYTFTLYDFLGNQINQAAYVTGIRGSSIQDFTGDGTTVNFTLSAIPASKNATQVNINGVYQNKNTYSLAGAVLTFSQAPPLTSTIEVSYF